MDTLSVNRTGNTQGKRPDLLIPAHLFEESVLLPDQARVNGTVLLAPRGWGKSLWLSALCQQNLMRGIGTVVLDAVGATIDNCLQKFLFLPKREQEELGENILYCNMAGQRVGETALDTLVTAWPMLYKQDKYETFDETAQRIVDLMKKTNKALETAGVQGMPRVQAVLTNVFQILAANKLPISNSIDMIQDPDSWRETIVATAARHKEVERAATRLLSYTDLPPRTRETQAEIILNRLQRIEFDVIAEGMYSATPPLVNWDDVVREGKQVLIDLRYEKSQTSKELKLFWVWGTIYEYIKRREASGREYPPLQIVIDELSNFVRGTSLNTGVITDEFRDFIQVYMRNANIWFTAATQEVEELPSELRRACLKLGTHLYGAIDTPELARKLTARRNWDVDPKIKGYKRSRVGGLDGSSTVLDIPVLETGRDIQSAYALELQSLTKGEWLAGVSMDEGEPPTHLERIETLHIDEAMYVEKDKVDQLKRYFMERDGRLVKDVLSAPKKPHSSPELLEQQAAVGEEISQDPADSPEGIGTKDFQSPQGVELPHLQEPTGQQQPGTETPKLQVPVKKKKKDRRHRIKES